MDTVWNKGTRLCAKTHFILKAMNGKGSPIIVKPDDFFFIANPPDDQFRNKSIMIFRYHKRIRGKGFRLHPNQIHQLFWIVPDEFIMPNQKRKYECKKRIRFLDKRRE